MNGGQRQSSWYKDAVIYQIHIRSFSDSNEDGVGDFPGLTSKLDYVQSLGVTAIWLQPFFLSPMRDDGYDISDYTQINPIYGDLDDFRVFLEEAHQRELRVITELVMNHTSDRHAWFQKSRRAAPGEEWREFYVWSDDDRSYAEARVIFSDSETSNWTWDPVAKAYFWHRFYHHQPDLNFDHPGVRSAMLRVIDFWLGLGVDGLRLDAVPYLFEREGTNCENLSETHAFLREVRLHVDTHHRDKMLLAEANQWPEDAAAYFGVGDECHMNFHFPLMPRLFMAVEREDRFPVMDILEQTPDIPAGCQWGIFLRNHDELTLEMVTDEERDYMYRTYAASHRARVNVGIRRRLAPLLRDNRRKMELMNALLLSLPGTPVLYYGDEICMGDNVYLGDRDSVRTPMQWSDDRNAGFSRANPQQIFLPAVVDPLFHYASRNVEVDQSRPHSMLWWIRRIIGLRKRFDAFGRGTIEFLAPANHKVLAYLRAYGEDVILVVANLSRFSQYVELNLSAFRGRIPLELFGQTKFPQIGEWPYLLTLGPYAFYWFQLKWLREDSEAMEVDTPEIEVPGEWDTLFTGRSLRSLEAVLPSFLQRARWFSGKARPLRKVGVLDALKFDSSWSGAQVWRLLIIQVEYLGGEPEVYSLPVGFAAGRLEAHLQADHPGAAIAHLLGAEVGTLCEATWADEFWRVLWGALAGHWEIARGKGFLEVVKRPDLPQYEWNPEEASIKVLSGEQSHTSAVIGDQVVVKLYRRLWEGENPEIEMGRVLTDGEFRATPKLLVSLDYRQSKQLRNLASVQEYVKNEGTGWRYTLDEISRFFETVGNRGELESWGLAGGDQGAGASSYLHMMELLGERTAELHCALAAVPDAAFTPEPFTTHYQRNLYHGMRAEARQTLALLRTMRDSLAVATAARAERLLQSEGLLLARYRALVSMRVQALRIRCHGDFHLGQVLFTGRDFIIIDFEGEAGRPISERRIKASPLSDVAGMLRSFHYAGSVAFRHPGNESVLRSVCPGRLQAALRDWRKSTAECFLKGYLSVARDGMIVPESEEEGSALLQAYLLHKAIYELRYELNNRPDWVDIPLGGLLEILDAE